MVLGSKKTGGGPKGIARLAIPFASRYGCTEIATRRVGIPTEFGKHTLFADLCGNARPLRIPDGNVVVLRQFNEAATEVIAELRVPCHPRLDDAGSHWVHALVLQLGCLFEGELLNSTHAITPNFHRPTASFKCEFNPCFFSCQADA